jgi:hypothetical protein
MRPGWYPRTGERTDAADFLVPQHLHPYHGDAGLAFAMPR